MNGGNRNVGDRFVNKQQTHSEVQYRCQSFIVVSALVLSITTLSEGYNILLPSSATATCRQGSCRRFGVRSSPRPFSCPSSLCMIYAPPGSGYASREEEESELPDSYVPMMEYPGTMRPGRTPENVPFHDLPIADSDPDPVPWPHFQQIEWHHKWEPPHPHPIPMEQFIDMYGRWATPEMEAAMRAGVRRDVRERQQQEQEDKSRSGDMIITDDDDDDDYDDANSILSGDEPIALGDGVFGQLGSIVDTAPPQGQQKPPGKQQKAKDDEDDFEDDGDIDDFLLDLGLDVGVDLDDDDDAPDQDNKKPKPPIASPSRKASINLLENDVDEDEDTEEDGLDLGLDLGFTSSAKTTTAKGGKEKPQRAPSTTQTGSVGVSTISVDGDDDLDLGLDDDDDLDDDGVSTVPLEVFDDDDPSDTLSGEDIFDEGGFDFDDGDFGDGGDSDGW